MDGIDELKRSSSGPGLEDENSEKGKYMTFKSGNEDYG